MHAPHLALGPVTVHFGEKNGKYPDGNQVVVHGADTRLAFDMPPVAHRLGAALDGVDAVVLGHVHEDHMAGLPLLPGVPVWVHEADVDAARSWTGMSRHYGYPEAVLAEMRPRIEREFHYRPRPDALAYADGQAWDLGGGVRVHAIHLPGHTAGHCVLLVEPAGIAFIGDIDLSSFGPYYGDASSSLADFRRSLARLPDLPASTWITSHHKGVVQDRGTFLALLRAYAARLDERDDHLLALLADGPQTLAGLAARHLLYPPEHQAEWVDCVERRSISQHLQVLVAEGRVVEARDACGEARYRLGRG